MEKTDTPRLVVLLERLEVSVDDFLGVQVLHAGSDLPGPAHHLRGEDLDPRPDVIVERSSAAVLQDDAIARRLRTDTPKKEIVAKKGLHNTDTSSDRSGPLLLIKVGYFFKKAKSFC